MGFVLPGIGGTVPELSSENQSSPLLNKYSPRLFGSPPQMTNLNDMRLMSADDDTPGPVGDHYLQNVLLNAQVANFVVGRAQFTGGVSSIVGGLRQAIQYASAMNKYDIYGSDDGPKGNTSSVVVAQQSYDIDDFNKSLLDAVNSDDAKFTMNVNEDGTVVASDDDFSDVNSAFEKIGKGFTKAGGTLVSTFLSSVKMQQPFYTFESDWYTYINNVKMMINSAVIMLGLQNAYVRIGDQGLPIGMDVKVSKDTDVWSNYRFITPSDNLGTVTAVDNMSGDTHQYVSFMIDPKSINESFTNDTTESTLMSEVMQKGESIGTEVAFITNASQTSVDDALINLTGDISNIAERVLSSLGGGAGRFAASIAGSMARSFTGDHTIYPKIFGRHSSTSSIDITVKLRATAGDPYHYLTEILVPYFFILGMVLPKLSKNNAAAYQFPPIVQCNIPGMWGTRLGMVTNVSATKNPDGDDISINGYPLGLDVTIRVEDLCHVMVTSPMNEPATFLNNSTMFDYIAQCAGVDKFRVNGSMRIITKLALASSAVSNAFYNIGNAFMNDFTSLANKITKMNRI